MLPDESMKLLSELQFIFRDSKAADNFAANPDLRDLMYRPFWKPRDSGSPCLLPGVALISDGEHYYNDGV